MARFLHLGNPLVDFAEAEVCSKLRGAEWSTEERTSIRSDLDSGVFEHLNGLFVTLLLDDQPCLRGVDKISIFRAPASEQ